MTGYLANATGPVTLVLDLRIDHDRFGSTSDPSINGHLHYQDDLDRSLNETVTDKFDSIVLTIIIVLLTLSPFYLLLLVRLGEK